MYCPIAQPEVPGLLWFSVLTLYEVNCPVGVLVSGIALENFGLATLVCYWLIVVVVLVGLCVFRAIPDDLEVPIPSIAGVNPCVPLSDLGRDITMFTEDFRPEWTLLRVIYTAGVRPLHPHRLHAELVMTGQQRRPRGHTPGTDIGRPKPHSFPRQPVNRGGFHPGIGFGIGAHGSVRMIISVDEQDVGTVIYLFRPTTA